MKSYIKYILTIGLFSVIIAGASAQPLQSAYFLERAPLRHQLNPALIPERGYFTIPGLGNISFNVSSDLNYTTFIYPSDGDKLNTFLSSAVSAEEFDKKIRNSNALNANIGLSILSFGFHKWNGFNTFDISLHSNISFSLPGDLFRFLKNGSEGNVTQYDLKDVSANANAYVEVALGHAHRINDQWTVGAKDKALLGGAQADAHFEKLTLTMAEDQWKIESYGVADLSLAGATLETDAETGEITGFDYDTNGIGLAGGGAGIDLGVTYTPIENLIVSMAITNIGFISWNKNLKGVTPEGEVIYDGFTHGKCQFQTAPLADARRKRYGIELGQLIRGRAQLWPAFHRSRYIDHACNPRLHTAGRLGCQHQLRYFCSVRKRSEAEKT